jgi:hypothetical protein
VPTLRSSRPPRPQPPAGAFGAVSALLLLLAATLASCSRDAARRTAPAPLARDSAAARQRHDATVFAIIGDVAQDSLLRGQVIHVGARDTTLTLSGTLPDSAMHERLLEIARPHVGIFVLVDSVRVAPAGVRPAATARAGGPPSTGR